MKSKIYIALLALASAAGIAACADLGFGIDVDSSGANPYWYGNGYLGDSYWNTPVWNYGPIYNPVPPRPPLIGEGPGSIGMPQPPERPQPPRRPVINTFPGMNGVPSEYNGVERPGNGGGPTPASRQRD